MIVRSPPSAGAEGARPVGRASPTARPARGFATGNAAARTRSPFMATNTARTATARGGILTTRTASVLLAAALGVGLVLRLREAARAPFWFDEIFTVWIARLGFGGSLQLLRHDMHPPLFFAGVVLWRSIVGEHTLPLRLLPIAFGVATVAATYRLARESFGRAAGLLAAAMVVLHRDLVYESTELRSFALLWFFQVVAAWAALRWTTPAGPAGVPGTIPPPGSVAATRSRDAAIYVMACAAGLYTHYLAGVVIAVIAAWGAIRLWPMPRRLGVWIALHLVVALLFLPQLPTFRAQLALNRVSHWVTAPTVADLAELVRRTCFGATWLIVPFAAFAALAFRPRGARAGASLFAIVVVVPVLVTWALTRQGAHLFTVRYMEYVVPFVMALVAGGVFALPRRRWAMILGVAIVAFAARSLAVTPPRPEPAELERLRERLAPLLGPRDAVFCIETHSQLFFDQYLPEARSKLVVAEPIPYYEGATILPAGELTTAAAFDSVRASGVRWWAVRVHHVGMDGAPMAARLESVVGRPMLLDGGGGPLRFAPAGISV
jgi:4-amino-4-deoxy-L-arabinose transferase-like glycosyltransferase